MPSKRVVVTPPAVVDLPEVFAPLEELGMTVEINPMSAHDRRIIHMALKGDARVSTRSEGDGLYRKLVITPAGD